MPGIIASGLVSSRGIQKDLKKLEEKEGNQYVKLKAIENHRNYKFSTEVSAKLISIICNNSIANWRITDKRKAATKDLIEVLFQKDIMVNKFKFTKLHYISQKEKNNDLNFRFWQRNLVTNLIVRIWIPKFRSSFIWKKLRWFDFFGGFWALI